MSYRSRVRPGLLRRLGRWSVPGSLALLVWMGLPLDPAMLAPPARDGVMLTDRGGAVLRSTRAEDGSRQQWIPIGDIDPDLLVAFVGLEDRRYYSHPGVDPLAAARAAGRNLAAGRIVSGASTISMQVARLLRGSPRTWFGKAEQALWALRIDARLGKQAVLEQYLNRVPLGRNAVGVEAAARLYFGVSARAVSPGQAAMLAGLAHAPGRDNPFVSPARATIRRDRVLARLVHYGWLLPADAARAALEPVSGGGSPAEFLAPHFTTWALGRLESGSPGRVPTTLDLSLQRQVEAEVRHTVGQLRGYGAEHAATVVLDNVSGAVLAWVGSPDFDEPVSGQVDMVVSPRQPGSTLKPFLYAMAFERGLTPASILRDVATVYPTATGPYAPRNYDRSFRGPVRAREALASSYNVPAVEMASRLGVAPFLDVLHRAGFQSLGRRADHYGLGLALGNGDVTLLELANAYRALANGGVWAPIRWRLDGVQADSQVRVVSAAAATQVLDILADRDARLPGFGPATPLDFGFRAAAKTGTSRHFTDNWAVATTGRFTVAVWAGNFSGRPMAGASGITGAGPLLQRVMLVVAGRYPPGDLPRPGEQGLVALPVCRLSGLVSAGSCPSLTEWFQPGTEPGPDTWYDEAGRVRLPAEFADWATRREAGNAVSVAGSGRIGTEEPRPGFRITSPRQGDRFRFVPGVEAGYATVGLRAAGGTSRAVRWFVDGKPHPGRRWPIVPGRHRITAVSGTDRDEVVVEVVRDLSEEGVSGGSSKHFDRQGGGPVAPRDP